MAKTTLLSKEYGGEDLVDMQRDLAEMWNPDLNPSIADIPDDAVDEHGIHKGKFRVRIYYCTEDDCDCTGFRHAYNCQHFQDCD